MSAIRLARAFTKRKYIIKFEGCYHGHADSLLVKAGSGVATFAIPGSAGVLEEISQFTIALPFNDTEVLEQVFSKYRHQIACVIVEPVVGNMGCVPGNGGYLANLRTITEREKTRPDFRRSHDRLPRSLRRRAGAVRNQARPHDVRENHRRRSAGRRLWGPV